MGTVPVYVNGARRSPLRARHLTDSRGLPLDPGTQAVAGTIVRVLRARERDADDGAA